MTKHESTLDNVIEVSDRFDTVIGVLLAALLVFMPLAFGVVHGWSEEVVIGGAGAIVVCFLLKLLLHPNQKPLWTWAYVPIGLFLLTAAFQLLPLPTWFVSIISPNTAALRTHLLGDLPDADVELRSMTLSFYPNATIHDLRLALAATGVFVVVFHVFRQPQQIKRLLMVIAVTGGFVAAVALAQGLFGNGKIYWFISSSNCKGYSGPFVNHSNYGQFMNLSIGSALALFLVKLHEAFAGKRPTPPAVFEYLSSLLAKSLWLLIAVIILGTATVFVSLTRGGVIAMLIALAFTAIMATSQHSLKGHSWIMVMMALAAFTCVLYVGFDAVYDRLASLRSFHESESGRLQILKDIAAAWTQFPILGTGLGTHSVVYPMFDRSTITALAAHAENEYAQALEETGLIGLGLLIIFGIIIWFNYAKSTRSGRSSVCSAAYGLGFGILAILIHSLTDFGQHLPANAFLSAVFCALLIALAHRSEKNYQEYKSVRTSGCKTLLSLTALAGVILIWIWALAGADRTRAAETYWQKTLAAAKRLADKNWKGTETDYADLISHAEQVSATQPENVKYRYWLNVYRWRSIGQQIDPYTGQVIIPESSMPTVYDIVAELHKACIVCPTYGPAYSIVGQIEKFILNDDTGAERIRKGFRLAPCDPIACFVAGWLDAMEEKTPDCITKFDRAAQLDPDLFPAIVAIYINYLSRPDLAVLSAGDDINRLNHVASVLEDMQYNDLVEQTREKIKKLLEVTCSKPHAAASTFVSLANIYRKQGNNQAAIEYYRRALALDYGQVEWRLELARLLAEMQRIPEAIREVRTCLRLHPEFKAAQELLADLSVHPAAFVEVKEKDESPQNF